MLISSEDRRVPEDRVMDAVLVKAKWADDHIGHLNREIRNFLNTGPYIINSKKDPQTREYIFTFMGAEPFPRCVPGLVGDILFNLRSALDHLAWQLVRANRERPGIGTYFPIVESLSTKKGTAQFARMVKGMRQETIEAIKRLKPCKGGNEKLWLLHELNRIDKHREILGIGTAPVGYTATPTQQREILEAWQKSNPNFASVPDFSQVMVSAPTIRLLKPGDTFRSLPEPEYDPNMKIVPQVCFDVPGTIDGKSVIDTLQNMKNLVIRIIVDFRNEGHFRLGS